MKNFSIEKINLNKEYIQKINNFITDGLNLIIDIGGTKTLIRIKDNKKSTLSEKRFFTKDLDYSNPEEFVKRIYIESKKLVSKRQFKIVSISTPGAVNNNGEIIKAPNLGWSNLNLKKVFEKEFNCKTILINDCNAGAIAEKFENPELKNLMYITVSSGIGGGLVLNNKLYLGENFCSAEIGHLVVVPEGKKCVCGNKGCIQEYCSGKGLYRDFKKYYPENMSELRILSDIFTNEDVFIQKELEESFKKLAQLLSIFSGLLDLNNFRLGGGLMKYSQKILKFLNEWTNYYRFNKNEKVKIQKADSYPYSSIVGAEFFAKIFEYESK